MTVIEKLTELFSRFPGVGQRQAKRFVYYLLFQDKTFSESLIKEIEGLKKTIRVCEDCFRFFNESSIKKDSLCSICSNKNRDLSTLMVISYDNDLDNLEKSGVFKGRYFVLGGTVPILEKEPEKKIRLEKLKQRIKKLLDAGELKEIVLAMNFTPEGENTGEFIKKSLAPLLEKYSLKISTLGKGLSSGLELEYSDSETLKNALANRQ